MDVRGKAQTCVGMRVMQSSTVMVEKDKAKTSEEQWKI
jgi:hypothetical protein